MRDLPREYLLDVVACEIGRRPEAPVFADLEPHVVGFSRQAEGLTISFAPEARETLKAFAEAERQCCAGIGWTVSEGPDVALRIEAGPAQLDAFAAMLQTEDIEDAR